METLSDEALIARVAAGERPALGELVRRHQAAVYRYACSLCGRPEQAEDVLQQAFLDAMRGAKTFEGRSTVRGWLLTLTRNAAFRGARRRAGEPAAFVPLEKLGCLAGWGADPERATQRAFAQQALQRALARLSPEQQEVIVLRDLEGFTGPEAAEILGVTLAALKSRLHRARLELAASVQQEARHGT